jgi:drug/metabolite transporter (DMT)-like permease
MQPTHRTPPFPPALALVFGILAVSTAAIFIRYAQEHAPSLVIAAYRLSLAALMLAPAALLRHRHELLGLGKKRIGLGVLAGVFLAFHFASWITSLEGTSVASSVVLVTTTPLWVALLSPFVLKERLSRLVLMGLGLALLGGMLIGLASSCTWQTGELTCLGVNDLLGQAALRANLLALLGAVMAAVYLLIGRSLRSGLSLVPYIFVVYGSAAVVLIGMTLAAGQSLTGYPPQAYLWFALLALVPQLFGHSVFNWSLRYLSAAFVAITLLGEPIGSTILAYFLLNEAPGGAELIGAILILTGIYIASRSETPPAPAEPQA